jgi:hypothetical protein
MHASTYRVIFEILIFRARLPLRMANIISPRDETPIELGRELVDHLSYDHVESRVTPLYPEQPRDGSSFTVGVLCPRRSAWNA